MQASLMIKKIKITRKVLFLKVSLPLQIDPIHSNYGNDKKKFFEI